MNQDTSQELPVKLYRSKERLTLAAPMPGLEPQDIAVVISATEVILEGRPRGTFKGDKQVLRDEWSPGPYYRRLTLPNPIDATLANLTYENGIVVLSVPIADQTTPATLSLERLGSTVGIRIGNAGHPVHAASMAEHNAAKSRLQAGSSIGR